MKYVCDSQKASRRIKRVIKKISVLEAQTGIPACIIHKYRDLPARLQGEPGIHFAKGLYDQSTNQVFLFVSELESVREGVQTYLHELSHLAVFQGLGKEMEPVLLQIYKSIPFMSKRLLRKRYKAQIRSKSAREKHCIIAHEFMSELAENGIKPSLWQRFKAWLRAGVRVVIPSYRWSLSEMIVLLDCLKMKVGKTGPTYSRQQVATRILDFVSNRSHGKEGS